MATLAEVVRKQRKSGGGVIGSLASAIGQKTLETIDPRRMLNQRGVLTSLFPSLKAYEAKGSSGADRISRASSDLSMTSPTIQEMNSKLDIIGNSTRLTAKNSMTLPGMSRDMNIMRQNIVKLVKLQGGEASTRADAFFLKAGERERATETELKTTKEKKVTQVKPEQKKESSIFEKIMGASLFLKIALFGAAIVGIVSVIYSLNTAFQLLKSKISDLLDFFKAKPLPAESASSFKQEGFTDPTDQGQFLDSSVGIPTGPVADFFQEDAIRRAKEREASNQTSAETNRLNRQFTSSSPTPVTEPKQESTSPRLVPSVPPDELGGINYTSYAQEVGKRESGGNYKAVNSLGYLGKYQFGAMALEDLGLVKTGVGKKGLKALDDNSNWNIEGGKEAFLNNPSLQEQTMVRYTKMNFGRLKRLGVINNETPSEKVAGFLASAHLVGPGGAAAMSRGEIRKDAYGTSAQSYFKLGSASQGDIQPAPSTSGAQVAAASSEVIDSSRAAQTQQPVVVNAPTTNVNQSRGGGSIIGSMADTMDRELSSLLVDRMVGA